MMCMSFVKLMINSTYGKFAQHSAALRDNPFDVEGLSAISCPALAAYMTSVCRAVVAELINYNDWVCIATDAVVILGEYLRTGYLVELIQNRMDRLNYTFVEKDFIALQALFVKARGYLMWGHKVKDGEPYGPLTFKMAAMGMKVDRKPDEDVPERMGAQQVDDFMTGLTSGELKITNFQAFSSLEKQYEDKKVRSKELQQLLKNNRNTQSRIRISAGVNNEQLRKKYNSSLKNKTLPFHQFEKQGNLSYFSSLVPPKPRRLKNC